MNHALPTKPKKKDGRTLRGERSRNACARSMLELIREGQLQPTAASVAERAGVSLRLVFHHFKDMEAVMRHAMQLQSERIAPLLPVTIPDGAAIDEKIAIFADRRAAFYEEVTPVRRAARHLEPGSRSIAEGLKRVRKLKRDQVAFLFRTELTGLGDGRVSIVQTVSSWMSWESLRTHQGLGVDDAKSVLRDTLQQLMS